MKKYRFETYATMKEYNSEKYWICSDIIGAEIIEAETLRDALEEFRARVNSGACCEISESGLRNRSPMYHDTKTGESEQIGYVITAKTEIDTGRKWSTQYIDLWVTVTVETYPDFPD